MPVSSIRFGMQRGLRGGGTKGADAQWPVRVLFLPLTYTEMESATPSPALLAYPSLGCSWDSRQFGKAKEY